MIQFNCYAISFKPYPLDESLQRLALWALLKFAIYDDGHSSSVAKKAEPESKQSRKRFFIDGSTSSPAEPRRKLRKTRGPWQ
jgi:hypothetical protein